MCIDCAYVSNYNLDMFFIYDTTIRTCDFNIPMIFVICDLSQVTFQHDVKWHDIHNTHSHIYIMHYRVYVQNSNMSTPSWVKSFWIPPPKESKLPSLELCIQSAPCNTPTISSSVTVMCEADVVLYEPTRKLDTCGVSVSAMVHVGYTL